MLLALKKYGAIVADNAAFFRVDLPRHRFPEGSFDNLRTVSIAISSGANDRRERRTAFTRRTTRERWSRSGDSFWDKRLLNGSVVGRGWCNGIAADLALSLSPIRRSQ